MTTKHTESSDTRCQLRFADGRRCALPAHPQGDGLCYPHAHAPHRRLRPSDLTRELASPSGAAIPAAKIHRVLAKLPIALADGTISPSQFGALYQLCCSLLQCSRLSATELPSNTHDPNWNFVATLLNEDDDELSPLRTKG
jgi:hypothetical protein